MTESNHLIYKQRIAALNDQLEQLKLDALLVTHDDEYLSYELTPDCERIKFISGFSGSAGYVAICRKTAVTIKQDTVITGQHHEKIPVQHTAAIFVDGRYLIQVKEQVDLDSFDIFNYPAIYPADYFNAVLEKGSKVGIDLNCISYNEFINLQNDLAENDIELVPVKENVIDSIWTDRPEKTCSKVEIFPDEFNGEPSSQKKHNLALELRERDLDATIICDPESICWLLNIRGHDRPCLPVVNCRMVAYSNEALEWYIDDEHLIDTDPQELEKHFGHVDIFPESRFDEVLQRLCSSSSNVYADPKSVNAHILSTLHDGGAQVMEGLGLCLLPKACKNEIEIAGEFNAHLKDGVAMCRFLSWLDDITDIANFKDQESFLRRVGDIDEAVLADRAESFRKVEADYIEPSFDTISALGANAAMAHYNYLTVKEPKKLGSDSIYLIDSGAHYMDGTTDITRTVLVGPEVSDEIMRMYTIVLKAHISLATLIFPKGTSGMQIDAIARRPLWDHGLDYAHGTGHGVGHLLSVHEGPQAISSHQSTTPLMAGMIISDEPGFYKEGNYGIRLENLLVVQECSQPGLQHMLCFAPLTMVPFDTRLIVKEMLTTKEREWINNYHQNINHVISNTVATLTDTEINWLNRATESF
ncbi:MAG TPA: aminopeptidase P family protein [Succinivibrionaceae bacterium]|nr:aminopeptidase P family protein [Succinivibrio sp.]HAR80428.1 aminopeptidase P family protein [Succinivibrionaceae bacterium]